MPRPEAQLAPQEGDAFGAEGEAMEWRSPEKSFGGQPAEEPDLAEQEEAIERRLGTEETEPQEQETAAPIDPDTIFDRLAGPDEEAGFEEGAAPEYADPGNGQSEDDVLKVVVNHLAEREAEQEAEALNEFAERNPDIRKPEVLREVAARVNEFAERAGDEGLLSDPWIVEQAFFGVMAERAQAAEVPATEARLRGAPLETEAGASAPQGGELSYEDRARREIGEAGGSAFPI